jgi:hypothetical protein
MLKVGWEGACGWGSRCSPPGDSRRLLHRIPVAGWWPGWVRRRGVVPGIPAG